MILSLLLCKRRTCKLRENVAVYELILSVLFTQVMWQFYFVYEFMDSINYTFFTEILLIIIFFPIFFIGVNVVSLVKVFFFSFTKKWCISFNKKIEVSSYYIHLYCVVWMVALYSKGSNCCSLIYVQYKGVNADYLKELYC